jgi:hypothetical protein
MFCECPHCHARVIPMKDGTGPLRTAWLVVSALLAVGCAGGSAGTDAGWDALADGPAPEDDGAILRDDGGPGSEVDPADDGGATDIGDPGDPGGLDPCPDLPVPPACFNRSVVYRVWGPDAKGDGSFFADQAPYRLGFNRIEQLVWIVKFRTDSYTYWGRVSAYGDSSAGVAWISDSPCDPTFAVDNQAIGFGIHGGGSIDFVVARDDVDADRLRNESPYREGFAHTPLLRGGHCYYLGFENTDYVPPQPFTVDFFSSTPDTCGHTLPDGSYDPSCYYLAMDFSHYLVDPINGALMNGNIISGLTQYP